MSTEAARKFGDALADITTQYLKDAMAEQNGEPNIVLVQMLLVLAGSFAGAIKTIELGGCTPQVSREKQCQDMQEIFGETLAETLSSVDSLPIAQ